MCSPHQVVQCFNMKFLVLVISFGVALARPDVSHLGGGGGGYNYNNPSGSYLPGTGGISGGGITSGGISGGYNQAGGAQEQKHIYFYAAPEDEGPARLRVNVEASNAKNTKIIFIKAPSAGGVIPEVIAPPSSAEDKTLVYVLVKKQDQGGQITIPSSLGVKQAKPEVYFIKYRNQQEAEQAVQSGLGGGSAGSGLSDLGSEQAFIRTIKDSQQSGIGGSGGFGGGDISGSNILGGSVSGGFSSSGGFSGGSDTKYGAPGASGPYKK